MDATLAIIKPDAMERGLDVEVMRAVAQEGFQVLAMRRGVVPADAWARFYAEHDGKPFFSNLVHFMASGPIAAMALAMPRPVPGDPDYVALRWRWLLGATDARAAGPGTLRARFGDKTGTAIYRNVAHGSDSHRAAQRELPFFFSPSDLDPRRALRSTGALDPALIEDLRRSLAIIDGPTPGGFDPTEELVVLMNAARRLVDSAPAVPAPPRMPRVPGADALLGRLDDQPPAGQPADAQLGATERPTDGGRVDG